MANKKVSKSKKRKIKLKRQKNIQKRNLTTLSDTSKGQNDKKVDDKKLKNKKKNNIKTNSKKEKKNKVKNLIVFFITLCLLSTLSFSIYKLVRYKIDARNTQKQLDRLLNPDENSEEFVTETPVSEVENLPTEDKKDDKKKPLTYEEIFRNESYLKVNFDKLKKINDSTVGWIKVNGTAINYPVVQANNNQYYLNRSFDKSYNGAGWIYMDYRNSSNITKNKNTIIYGHGQADGTMFGSLKNVYRYKDWFNNKSNHVIKLSTENEMTLWQIFSVYIIKSESYYLQTKFYSTSNYKEFINTIKKRSKWNFKQSVTTKDKILTLSSCYNLDDDRIVVHAKLIKVSKK